VRKARIIYYGNDCQMTTTALDDYVIDTLMGDLVRHDRAPSAFLVYVLLWRLTHGQAKANVRIALQDIAEVTGLSKRSVQSAIGLLVKRKLIAIARESITAIPVYSVMRPWKR
jgi:DNA-binding GntR family transcriptional regulator